MRTCYLLCALVMIIMVNANAQETPDWENPAVTAINWLEPRATFRHNN